MLTCTIKLMKYFKWSIIITAIGMLTSFLWGGFTALALTLMLATLEISLSFDNAVINIGVLQKMSPIWQARFLTWGILVAVFIVRLLLPLIIVAFVSGLSPLDVATLAILNPIEYSKHLSQAQTSISAFGGLFLILVFLSFLFDVNRSIHWFGILEKKLNKIGSLKSIEILIALCVLLITQYFVLPEQKNSVLIAGIVGITLYVFLKGIMDYLGEYQKTELVKKTGVMGFLYLEVLDASFSFDGVIGAFAITKDIVIILLGLTIGAIFVRSLTVFLAHKGTLNKYLFLQHGAHYAIGALGLIMLINLVVHIPEIVTGSIGVCFIGVAFISSIRHNRKKLSI